jgi:beta-glucosidase
MFMRNLPAFTYRVIALGAVFLASLFSSAQLIGNNTQDVDKLVDDLLAKMTLDEKIDLIGGDTPFRTHPIPRLGIPYFQMADRLRRRYWPRSLLG